MIRESNFRSIHKQLIGKALGANDNVLFNEVFTLTDPTNNIGINSNVEYYKAFRDWLLTGSDMQGEFIKMSPKAQKYFFEYEGRNVAYGPRIVEQIPTIIKKLKETPNTRQAFLNILAKEDHVVCEHNNTADHIVEYPCTVGWYFTINNGKLFCTSIMRSNNICSVLGLDVFLGTSLQMAIAEALDIPLGKYTHIMLNGHIIPEEIDRAHKYLQIDTIQ